ncbi:MAG TPA: c-type cytochrome [Oligoflexia bacterium]|nr:c-type cytochrome [Oligoflexia bacterium]
MTENRSEFWKLTLVVFGLLFGWVALCRADDKTLTLKAGSWEKSYTLKQLQELLPMTELNVYDPVYKKEMNFEGFLLSDVLGLMTSANLTKNLGQELVFTAEDGFAPSMFLPDHRNQRAIVAFGEKGKNGGWSEFETGKTTTTPAPFYVVWQSSKLKEERYPRPYKLVKLEVVNLREKFPKVFPTGNTHEKVFRGFTTFKQHCLMCHSMNLEGGEVGPELNIPKNITEYRSEKTLRNFIRSAKSFRAKSKMPDFPQLTARELDGLMAYLKYMGGQKILQ